VAGNSGVEAGLFLVVVHYKPHLLRGLHLAVKAAVPAGDQNRLASMQWRGRERRGVTEEIVKWITETEGGGSAGQMPRTAAI
jgi:hypothetical protein